MRYLISRAQSGTTNGKPLPPRCWVTGPHLGRGVFSSTADVEKASRYTWEEVEKYTRPPTYWRDVRIVEEGKAVTP